MHFKIALCIFFLGSQLTAHAQSPSAKLNLIVVEGEGAINNISHRVAREPIIQVEDENRKPVAGAAVTFILPDGGASGVFLDGSRSLITVTDESGRAVARGLQTNRLAGKFQIRVTASFQGQVGSAVIHQVNAMAAAAGAAGGAAGAGQERAALPAGWQRQRESAKSSRLLLSSLAPRSEVGWRPLRKVGAGVRPPPQCQGHPSPPSLCPARSSWVRPSEVSHATQGACFPCFRNMLRRTSFRAGFHRRAGSRAGI